MLRKYHKKYQRGNIMKNKIDVGLTHEQDFTVSALKVELQQATHEKAITIATDLLTALFKKHNEMNILIEHVENIIEQHSIMSIYYKNQEETIKYLISRNQSQ